MDTKETTPVRALNEGSKKTANTPEEPLPIEATHTITHAPGNSNYYEVNELRTEGDGMDHNHYNPVISPDSLLLFFCI
jgi:hypothetical protein